MRQKLLDIYHSKRFQIWMDLCRIIMLVVVCAILYKLVTEIEAVKLLSSDVCKICMNKTGCSCWCP